jgi:Zn-dependent protease
MTNCAHCGDEIIGSPFHCSECGQNYCNIHKHPIDHECNIVKEGLGLQQLPSSTSSYVDMPQVSTPQQGQIQHQEHPPGIIRGTTDGTFTWFRQEAQIPVDAFDPDSGIKFKGILLAHKSEFFHLLIGSLLIFIIGLINFYNENLIDLGFWWAIIMLAGFYMTAFLFHEFGHRQVAKHFGFQTKFRLLTFGMALTAFSIVMGLSTLNSGIPSPTLALPGAVVVLGLDKISKETGLCKAAGPTVNLIYGIILLLISFIIPIYPLNYFIGNAASLNFLLGAFNMIPVGILDGQNIFRWSKKVYFILAGSLLILLIINYIIIYVPDLTNMIYPPL